MRCPLVLVLSITCVALPVLSLAAVAADSAASTAGIDAQARVSTPMISTNGGPKLDPASSSSTDRDWDLVVGMGAAVAPEYEGASRSVSGAAPFVSARWQRLSFDGVLHFAAVQGEAGSVSVGLGYDAGRRDSGGRRLNGTGSEDLKGLGTIRGAAVASLTATMPIGPLAVGGTISRWLGSNRFTTVNLTLEGSVPLTERLALGASVGSTWIGANYAQSYFGVTPQQAANSRYAEYRVRGGFKDISVAIQTAYSISPRWSILGIVQAARLRGDAAGSPIVQRRTGIQGLVAMTYQF